MAKRTAPRTTDTLFVVFVALAAVVGLVAMATSAKTLALLGVAVGWTATFGLISMSWALPVSVDALAIVGGLAWLASPKGSTARTAGFYVTLGAVTASVVMNGAGHLVEMGEYKPGVLAALVISAVPPIVAALVLHLVHLVAEDRRKARATDTEHVAPASEQQQTDTAAPEPTRRAPETDMATDTADTLPEQTDTATDTAALLDTLPDTFAGAGGAPLPYADTETAASEPEPETADAEAGTPEPGAKLSDTELDMVVTVLVSETEPPRSYNELEARFRELGYVASAARLRAAHKRVTAVTTG